VYKLCTAQPVQYDSQLYYTLKKYLEEHVDKLYQHMMERPDILNEYLKRWNEYETGCKYTSGFVFSYLNNQWINAQIKNSKEKFAQLGSNKKDIRNVYELALVTWKHFLFDKLKDRLCKEILSLIEKERNGDLIESPVVTGVINSYIRLGSDKPEKELRIYKQDFEVHYLNATDAYYKVEASNMSSLGISTYLKLAERRILEEESRAKKYLNSSSFQDLVNTCHKVLLVSQKDTFQQECAIMLRNDLRDDLRRMFHLLRRLEHGIDPMLEVLQKHIITNGLDSIKALTESRNEALKNKPEPEKKPGKPKAGEEEDDQNPTNLCRDYVEALLKIHNQFVDLVSSAFSNDANFLSTLDQACRKVVNENSLVAKDPSYSPELLALYTDTLLKKSTKHIDENELEDKLKQVILIFKYINDKDVFQKFYSKHLTKRLIHNNSVSDEAEKIMISGLKEACGFEYTIKLQRMFNDIGASTDLNDKFKEHVNEKRINLGMDVDIIVLTSGSWPIFGPKTNWILPTQLENTISEFSKFYLNVHSGRQLNWLHYLSKADLKMMYTSKKYEFQCTNYQLGILLLFNNSNELTESDLITLTGLETNELRKTVRSLLETKILLKKDQGEKMALILNQNFQSKRMKFKITSSLQQETNIQNAETRKSVQEDRNIFLQAAIVRIMKMRKQLRHVELVSEVIAQSKSRFQPHIPMIKRCIEHLIEKEYIERVESDLYSYVA